ncbi:MAG: serpin family protein [Enterocloster asparagiformis]|nr:serpin family protein [Enterocloster asparagiformis]
MMKKKIWRCAAAGAMAAAILAGCGQKSAGTPSGGTREVSGPRADGGPESTEARAQTGEEAPPVERKENRAEDQELGSLTRVREPEAIPAEDFDARRSVREDNPVSEEFAGAARAFSFETASRLLAKDTENRNYSPLSLYYALALAAQGAEGKTEQELLAVLGVKDKTELAGQCGNLYRLLYTDNEYSRLKLANSLWAKEGMELKEGFLNAAQDDFYASVYPVDFADPETGKAMGRWISQQTNGTLAPQLDTSPRDILAIINTVYFYDQWVNRFEQSANTQGTFTTAGGQEVKCEYMHLTGAFQAYYEGEGYSGTELWLKDNGSLFLILPDEGVDARDLIKQEGKLARMFERENGQGGLMDLSLPKFSFEDSMDLAEMLQDMGVKEAFGVEADFSAMSDEPAFISLIRQETHIGINEDGVEASAYTEIAVAGAGLPDGRHALDFNRPFIFGIISDSGIPLFLGVCNNPQ